MTCLRDRLERLELEVAGRHTVRWRSPVQGPQAKARSGSEPSLAHHTRGLRFRMKYQTAIAISTTTMMSHQ
jgi:hypothetical protein